MIVFIVQNGKLYPHESHKKHRLSSSEWWCVKYWVRKYSTMWIQL